MVLGLLAALGAAVCFGTASVLQAVAARRTAAGQGVDPRLLIRVVRQVPFLAGLCLDGLGFVLELVALRVLPLYVVGAAIAASLAVTAVVSARVFRTSLRGMEWGAIAAVCCGLALLAASAESEGRGDGDTAQRIALLCAALVVLGLGMAAGRLPVRLQAGVLGAASGLGFGIVAIAARMVPSLHPLDLVANPATYALVVGGASAFLFLTTAFQRGSVTAATAAMVIGETIGPALVGVLMLGDRTRDGLVPVAILGFLLAVTGAMALSRFGEVDAELGERGGHGDAPLVQG